MRHSFVGMADADIRRVVGLNAAEWYGFDVESLQPLVDEFGPQAGTFDGGELQTYDYDDEDFFNGAVFTSETGQRFARRLTS